jgi:hypothetical protein
VAAMDAAHDMAMAAIEPRGIVRQSLTHAVKSCWNAYAKPANLDWSRSFQPIAAITDVVGREWCARSDSNARPSDS